MPRTGAAIAARDAEIRGSTLAGHVLAARFGLSEAHVSRIRSQAPRPPTRRERFALSVAGEGWAAACMEPDEWADWVRDNPRLNDATFADRPCVDCPLGFAADMRAIGRCNGSPGAIGGRHETDDEEGEDEGAMLNQNERGQLGGVRGAQALELVPPPCETCLHEPICVLKIALQKARSTDVAVAPLPDGLSVVVTAKVDCRFYNPAKKVREPAYWSPERRAQAAERQRARCAAGTAFKPKAAAEA